MTDLAPEPEPRIPLILDVDTGIDDSLALLYACASPEVDLLAVTCVGGNTDARRVARNTLAVLELAGRDDVPVLLGREQPLVKPLETAAKTHGPEGLGDASLPDPARSLEADDAATRIIDLARERPGEILLVTLGPLTNVAVALEREPSLPRLVGAYALMGGAFRGSGNTTPTAEWNVYVDPDAARATFAAWAAVDGAPRPVAMGLEITERARLLPGHVAAIARLAGAEPEDAAALGREPLRAIGGVADAPVLRFLADALRFYFDFHARYDGFYGAFAHDPFVVAAALDASLIRLAPVFVDVETGSGPAHAMTVADWRGLTRRPANLDVAVEADAERFLEELVERLGRLAATRAGVAP
ncbi:MAG TPA: nucleoside hydrolase [Candidatus Deferrimicrobiaceae bacterium]|nr:nucleoside hydrolase [Candidatus Deferrimicrobiaceae bacterium]